MNPIINIENLKYKYPNTKALALDGITLSVEKGEFIGIIGRNGAGKSTLSQAMIGLVPQFYKGAYGGSVTVCGQKADRVPTAELCEHVGLIFQNPFNQLSGAKDTVFGEVAYGLQNLGIARQEMKQRVETVLKQLDIWQYRDRNPFDLSGGQMQRVAIASILVMQPDVIILDEPTSQLDPQGTEEVFRVVDQLSGTGITIIMIEQKIEKMAHYCDRLVLMDHGRMIACDTPEKIFSRTDLEEFGVLPPAFTRIARKYGVTDENGTYPAKLEDTVKLFRKKGIRVSTEDIGVRPGCAEVGDPSTAYAGSGHTDITRRAVNQVTDHTIFTVEHLDFSYLPEIPIFQDLNLLLDKRTTAIIGQNGAGKTTLVRLLKGLLKPVGGRILYGGEDISGKTVAMLADRVGYVFQNPDDQIFKYKVLDEVMFGPMNIGMTEDAARNNALAALELMGLKGKEQENPYDLELNERKMVAIASVVAMDTDVVILDEPTIAQDYPGRKRIGEMIDKLADKGKLVIAILHDMDFVAENFDRIIVMAKGSVLGDGSAEEIFAQDAILESARLQKPYMMQLCELLK